MNKFPMYLFLAFRWDVSLLFFLRFSFLESSREPENKVFNKHLSTKLNLVDYYLLLSSLQNMETCFTV